MRAIRRLGFVQADPIRAPARAQDLILRHRVVDYRAGDLERRYPQLPVEEDALVNYGFLPREHLALMHPREPRRAWDRTTRQRAADVLAFVREHGPLHPRDVDRHFAHGRVRTYWGGSGSASTQLLDGLHHRGLVRVARRDSGVRIYAAIEHPPVANDPPARRARADALIDLVLRQYAPLPSSSLGYLVRMLGHGAPHLAAELAVALRAARTSLAQVALDGVTWYWPADARPSSARHAPPDRVRLLAPFDPVVWDRARFEALWGWAYRFEAYTPAARRKLGYYALPLLWRDRVVGWGNASVTARGELALSLGYVDGRAPLDAGFSQALEEEVESFRRFL
ncbi:MAG: YcaQ family DNA glycosylase, partial [Burkholderiaceae bacterium]|nr:YcaQ family DNA glycosylase [Burkholderiaceae bacterium]MBP7661656.1 YcaQ family DNA glycosylase [Burkholderiaceae bacterium]